MSAWGPRRTSGLTAAYPFHAHERTSSDRVSAEAKKALADPALQAKLVEQGIVPMGSTPEEFRAFVAEEISRWRKVITDAGIKME